MEDLLASIVMEFYPQIRRMASAIWGKKFRKFCEQEDTLQEAVLVAIEAVRNKFDPLHENANLFHFIMRVTSRHLMGMARQGTLIRLPLHVTRAANRLKNPQKYERAISTYKIGSGYSENLASKPRVDVFNVNPEELSKALSDLEESERLMIYRSFGLDNTEKETLQEQGQRYRIGKAAMSARQIKVLKKLRKALE